MLEALNDGKWHSAEDVRRKARLCSEDFERIIKFLAQYSFIVVDEARGMLKLNENFLKIFT